MGASGKWVKAFIGLKKPEKEEHVSSNLFFHFSTCVFLFCSMSKTLKTLSLPLSLSIGQGGRKEQEMEAMEEFFWGFGVFMEGFQREPQSGF
jgi:hypothetical protein